MYEHLKHTLYVPNVANFELTGINNIFKCLGGFAELISTYTQRERVPQKRTKAYKGGGDPKVDEIGRTYYFLNGPIDHVSIHARTILSNFLILFSDFLLEYDIIVDMILQASVSCQL